MSQEEFGSETRRWKDGAGGRTLCCCCGGGGGGGGGGGCAEGRGCLVVDEKRKLDYAVKVQTRELDAVDGSTGLQLRGGEGDRCRRVKRKDGID